MSKIGYFLGGAVTAVTLIAVAAIIDSAPGSSRAASIDEADELDSAAENSMDAAAVEAEDAGAPMAPCAG